MKNPKKSIQISRINLFLNLSILLFSFILFNCSKEIVSEEERVLLYYLTLQNPGDTELQSIVEVTLRDFGSYEGKCLDTFLGISAGSYFNIQYPPESRNTAVRKVYASKDPCQLKGFKGGAENRIDGRAVSFKSYSCGASTSLCDEKIMKDSGF